jgi:isopenicillin N synthase-like dioxygenase
LADAPVPHVEDGFVVNIADLLQHWTCGRWRSTLHRVVAAGPYPQPARLSIVYFQSPNSDGLIEPIAWGASEGHASEPIQAGAFLEAKLARLFVASD